MDNMVDAQKTRRRIEEYLRKHANPETLVPIAKRLGVEVAFIPIPEVSELELGLAKILGKEIPSGSEAIADFIMQLLPRKFTVYYASFIDPKHPDEEPQRWSLDALTRKAVEEMKLPRANSISEEKLNILGMQGLLQQMRGKKGMLGQKGEYVGHPEDRAMFEHLERVVLKP